MKDLIILDYEKSVEDALKKFKTKMDILWYYWISLFGWGSFKP